jgi:hypothetical protein
MPTMNRVSLLDRNILKKTETDLSEEEEKAPLDAAKR